MLPNVDMAKSSYYKVNIDVSMRAIDGSKVC